MSLQMHDYSMFVLNAMEELSLVIVLVLQQERCAKNNSPGPNQGPQSSQIASAFYLPTHNVGTPAGAV